MIIKKGEFNVNLSKTDQPETHIETVIQPFQMMIESRQINVHIFKNFELNDISLHADWHRFKLAIFNLI